MSRYSDLVQQLEAAGVDLRSIRVNRTPSDSTFCILDYGDGEIEVFFFERGGKYDLQRFTDPEAAVEHFRQQVLSNPYLMKSFTERSNGT